jgi:hypothetical protein
LEDVTVTVMDEHDGGVDTLLLDVRDKLLDHISIVGGQDIPLLVGHTTSVQRGLSGISERGILGSPHLGGRLSETAGVGLEVEPARQSATRGHDPL